MAARWAGPRALACQKLGGWACWDGRNRAGAEWSEESLVGLPPGGCNWNEERLIGLCRAEA
jgi:hypothetical protein